MRGEEQAQFPSLPVQAVIAIIQRRQTPLVAREDLSRLQYTVDLRVHILPNGGVASGFDGIYPVEVVVREGQLHEVGLYGHGPPLGQ